MTVTVAVDTETDCRQFVYSTTFEFQRLQGTDGRLHLKNTTVVVPYRYSACALLAQIKYIVLSSFQRYQHCDLTQSYGDAQMQ